MMKPISLVATCLALVACTPEEPTAQAPAPAATPVVARSDVGSQLNAVRAANGLPALSQSAQLTAAAQAHANDMAANRFFSHTGSDNSKPSQRIKRQGYSFCFVAENIAQGQKTPEAVMATWMASSGHRANNLTTQATEYGAARGAGDLWVLVFAQPGC